VYQGDASSSQKFDTVILLNEYSASASEVFAAALKEHELATVIGLTSYGKGTIQSINSLTNGGMIKFTTGYYLTPLGNNIHGVGITPDVIVENSFTKPDKSEFTDFGYNKVYSIGDTHEDIHTAKEILSLYGLYQGELNDVFDKDLSYAVYAFQTQSGLFPYGVLDITTQIHIHNYLDIVEIEQDDQLKTAFEHFGMNMPEK
jgi:carboxyl-terminal processing protease